MIINFKLFINMKFDEEKIMPVAELVPAMARKEKKEFVLAYGEILLRALRNYEDSSLSPKVSFFLLLNMADMENFAINTRLYDEVEEDLKKNSWIEQKVVNFMLKRGWIEEKKLDLNELIYIGSTHYYLMRWGVPSDFRKDLFWFAENL